MSVMAVDAGVQRAAGRNGSAGTPLLEVQDLRLTYHTPGGRLNAVDGVSFAVQEGEILCLVGESGCGKTSTGKLTCGLTTPTSGRILFEGKDVRSLNRGDQQRYRRAVQIVHQDPYASLNPLHTIRDILVAPLLRHKMVSGQRQATARAAQLLEMVDLTPAPDFLGKYPHQLSGGQRQRIAIARALTVNPRFIVADEPVSMVDVSIRISLLNTMLRLQRELGTGFLFITHDLALAKYFAWHGRIGVMYLGRLVELAPTPQVVEHPEHPYTRALLSAIPEADPDLTRTKERVPLRSAEVPSLLHVPSGCAFHPRCPLFEPGLCDVETPALAALTALHAREQLHAVACHVVSRLDAAEAVTGVAGLSAHSAHSTQTSQGVQPAAL
jgi:oligopeptide/dipeptide ABC transporter ATP-binding protein